MNTSPLTPEELAARLEAACREIHYLSKRIKSLERRLDSQDALEDMRHMFRQQPKEYYPEY